MRKQSLFVIIAGSVLLAVVALVTIAQLSKTQAAYAQAGQRTVIESLDISRGQYSVATLASFPDGATKLALRDPNGVVGLVLAVYDRRGSERAVIEFYDSGGNKVRTIDAASFAPPSGPRVGKIDAVAVAPASGPQIGKKEQAITGTEARHLQDQIDDLRKKIDQVSKMVSKP
jgi:hypothetical protein